VSGLDSEQWGSIVVASAIAYGFFKGFVVGLFVPGLEVPWMTGVSIPLNLTVHGVLFLGWVMFLAEGGRLQRRDKWSWWIPVGIVVLLMGAVIPMVYNVFLRNPEPHYLRHLLDELRFMSETVPYSLGYGLALALFKIEDERGLMLFHIPIAVFWAVNAQTISLLHQMGLVPIPEGIPPFYPGQTMVMTTFGMPYWIYPYCLLDMWWWADAGIGYVLPLLVFSSLLGPRIKKIWLSF
jgi:hypothetical protein